MTRWKNGSESMEATHYSKGRRIEYRVRQLPSGFWLSQMVFEDGSTYRIDASELTEAGAMARCEYHAANH